MEDEQGKLSQLRDIAVLRKMMVSRRHRSEKRLQRLREARDIIDEDNNFSFLNL